MSHYDTLDVAKTADAATIKRAYRSKARVLHPDRDTGDAEQMTRINRAYENLIDPKKRKHYDETGTDLPPALPPNMEETQLLVQLLGMAVEQNNGEGDLFDFIRAKLHDGQLKGYGEVEKLQVRIALHERVRKRLKHKAIRHEHNFFDDFLLANITKMKADVEATNGLIALGGRCLALLEDFELEDSMTANQRMFGTFISFGRGP